MKVTFVLDVDGVLNTRASWNEEPPRLCEGPFQRFLQAADEFEEAGFEVEIISISPSLRGELAEALTNHEFKLSERSKALNSKEERRKFCDAVARENHVDLVILIDDEMPTRAVNNLDFNLLPLITDPRQGLSLQDSSMLQACAISYPVVDSQRELHQAFVRRSLLNRVQHLEDTLEVEREHFQKRLAEKQEATK